MSSIAQKRAQRDLKLAVAAFPSLVIVDDNIFHWRVVVEGASGTPYEGGKFLLDVVIPPEYPNSSPIIRFLTPIFHPSISHGDGKLCENMFGDWAPNLTAVYALELVTSLFADFTKGVLNEEAAQLVATDKAKFENRAKKETRDRAK